MNLPKFHLTALEETLFEKLKQLASMNSQDERKDFITSILRKRGIYFSDDYNIYIPSFRKPRIFIDAHVDTVPRLSPLRETEEAFYGTGVADNLGNVSIVLELLLEKGNFEDIEVIFSVDEEEGGTGAREITPEAPAGIVLEPTQLKLWNRHMGAVEVLVEIKTESSHGSYRGSFFDAFLEKLNYYKRLEERFNGLYVNLLHVVGGSSDLYATPEFGKAKLEIVIEPELNISDVLNLIPDKVVDYDEGFVENNLKFLPSVMVNLDRGTCPSWTNAIEYKRKGKNVVVFGAGNLYHCHTKREFLEKGELLDGYRILKTAIENRES